MKITLQNQTAGNLEDLAKTLQPSGIKKILTIIYDAYKELYKTKKIYDEMNEIKINEEFSIVLIKSFGENASNFKINDKQLVPFPSKPVGKGKKQGKFPEIDICFRDEIDSDSFFGIECKILRDDKNQNYTYYISNGVKRYLTGIYKGKCSHSSMVAYILQGNKNKIIQEIKKRMDKLDTIKPFQISVSIEEFNDHYLSVHELTFLENNFHLHHLFFSFIYNE